MFLWRLQSQVHDDVDLDTTPWVRVVLLPPLPLVRGMQWLVWRQTHRESKDDRKYPPALPEDAQATSPFSTTVAATPSLLR